MSEFKAVFRIKPIKPNALGLAIAHNSRSNAEKELHVDKSRIDKNIALIGVLDAKTILQDLTSEAEKWKPKDKRSGVVYSEAILTANKIYFDENFKGWREDSSVLKPWIDANLKFMQSGRIGLVKSAVLHLDEEAPHIHALSVPVTTFERGNRYGKSLHEGISYNELYSDSKQVLAKARAEGQTSEKTKLGRLQTAYARSVEHLSLSRGVTSTKGHITPRDFRKMINQQIPKELEAPTLEQEKLFNKQKVRNENQKQVNNLTKKLNYSLKHLNSLKTQNNILLKTIKQNEETIMEKQNIINNQNNLIELNKDYIDSARLLNKEVIIEKFGYKDNQYNDYNFNKKFNAIDFVKHVEKCDFKKAISLIAEHFGNEITTKSASQSEMVLKSIKDKFQDEKTTYELKSELDNLKKSIDLVEFAMNNGFELDKHAKLKHKSIKLNNGANKILVSRENEHDVFFTLNDKNKSGSVIDFCKHYLNMDNMGKIRKTLRDYLGFNNGNYNPNIIKKPIIKDNEIIEDKTLSFYNLNKSDNNKFLKKRGIIITEDIAEQVRTDEKGNACFPHYSEAGYITGWEKKNEGFKGFVEGGKKGFGLVQIGNFGAGSVVISEGMLDSLSYIQMHCRVGTAISTGGGMSERQVELIAKECKGRGQKVILAFDADKTGEEFTKMLKKAIPDAIDARKDLNGLKDFNELLINTYSNKINIDQLVTEEKEERVREIKHVQDRGFERF